MAAILCEFSCESRFLVVWKGISNPKVHGGSLSLRKERSNKDISVSARAGITDESALRDMKVVQWPCS